MGAVGWEQLISHELPSLSCVVRAPSAAAALAMAMLRGRERDRGVVCVGVCKLLSILGLAQIPAARRSCFVLGIGVLVNRLANHQ